MAVKRIVARSVPLEMALAACSFYVTTTHNSAGDWSNNTAESKASMNDHHGSGIAQGSEDVFKAKLLTTSSLPGAVVPTL